MEHTWNRNSNPDWLNVFQQQRCSWKFEMFRLIRWSIVSSLPEPSKQSKVKIFKNILDNFGGPCTFKLIQNATPSKNLYNLYNFQSWSIWNKYPRISKIPKTFAFWMGLKLVISYGHFPFSHKGALVFDILYISKLREIVREKAANGRSH